MDNRKIYRKRLLEKVEEKEARHKTLVDHPIEINSQDGVTILTTNEERRKLMDEIAKRMEDDEWNG